MDNSNKRTLIVLGVVTLCLVVPFIVNGAFVHASAMLAGLLFGYFVAHLTSDTE